MLPDQAKILAASSGSRRSLSGFFVSGLLMCFLGAILPVWGYHLRTEYSAIGHLFLGMNAGLLASVKIASLIVKRKGTATLLTLACALAFAALLYLSFTSAASPNWWRLLGFTWIGLAVGFLNTGLFHAVSAAYRLNPAATVNLAGTFFGTGCFLAALLISGTFNIYSVSSTLFVIALIPAFFAMMFSGTSLPADPGFEERTFRRAWNEFRSPLAVLFSLLLFLQFANEWSVAGWLTIFLIQRLGMSPAASLLILALYWLALLAGRILAQAVLPKVRHGRLLMGSVVAAMFGCTILFLTDNAFGACLGTLLVGVGFAPVYPLVVEKIGIRFPSYHPGLFNGIFSFALTGGLLAPWLLGYLADAFGIGVVIFFPLLGSFAVFVLLLMIWIGAKVSGALSQPQNSSI